MRYLNTYQHYIVNENSKNDPLPEITQGGKLGIILIGAPGIGKSTFARNYITHKNQNIKIFSTDDVSLTLTKGHNTYRRGSSQLNLKKLSMFIKSGGSFIYDTTGVKRENVESVTKEARDNGYNVIYVHLMGTLDLSLKQNLQRERNVPADVIKSIYAEQFVNMKYFASLKPEQYYVVYNIDGKYKFMKYDGNRLLKRKVDKYVPFNEDVDNKEFTIKDAYLSSIGIVDAGFTITFYDLDEKYLTTDDIDKETDKFKNFKLTKDIGNNRRSEFILEISNKQSTLSFDEFATVVNDMSVSVQDIAEKGWILSDFFASPDDDSAGIGLEHRFYHVRFVFTKPNIKINKLDGLEKEFNRDTIVDTFNNAGLDVDDITYYDNYIKVDYTDHNNINANNRIFSIVNRLGAIDYEIGYSTVNLVFYE